MAMFLCMFYYFFFEDLLTKLKWKHFYTLLFYIILKLPMERKPFIKHFIENTTKKEN